jgi:hypothetical protein
VAPPAALVSFLVRELTGSSNSMPVFLLFKMCAVVQRPGSSITR